MKISKRQLRRIIKEEKAKLLAEVVTPKDQAAKDGLAAIEAMYDAVDQLSAALVQLRQQTGGMEYDSMGLAKSSLENMKASYYLERIEDRLRRVVDAK